MIPLREQDYIRQLFAEQLTGPVKIEFFTQRPAPAQNRQLRFEALFVQPIEQLHRLTFGAARVETVD